MPKVQMPRRQIQGSSGSGGLLGAIGTVGGAVAGGLLAGPGGAAAGAAAGAGLGGGLGSAAGTLLDPPKQAQVQQNPGIPQGGMQGAMQRRIGESDQVFQSLRAGLESVKNNPAFVDAAKPIMAALAKQNGLNMAG